MHFHVSNIFNFIVLETRAKFLSGIFGRLHQSVPPKPSVTQDCLYTSCLITWPVFFSGRIDKCGFWFPRVFIEWRLLQFELKPASSFRTSSWTFYEIENFSYSSFYYIFESKNFRFPFSKKISPCNGGKMWKIKLKKIVGFFLDNLRLRKLYLNGTLVYNCLAVLKQ